MRRGAARGARGGRRRTPAASPPWPRIWANPRLPIAWAKATRFWIKVLDWAAGPGCPAGVARLRTRFGRPPAERARLADCSGTSRPPFCRQSFYPDRVSRNRGRALSIKTPEADELARSLARLTGESMTEAVTAALRERLARERARRETAAPSRRGWPPCPADCALPTTRGRSAGRNGMRRSATRDDCRRLLRRGGDVMSVASYLETGTVLAGRRRSDRLRAIDDLDAFLA